MKRWMKRFLYAAAFNLGTYVVVRWITDMSTLALVAGAVSFVLARSDWDKTHPEESPDDRQ
jgi:hypothetical protein